MLERPAFHIVFGSLFPSLIVVLPAERQGMVLALAVVAVVASLTLEVARRRSDTLNRWFVSSLSRLLRERESSHWVTSTYLLLATLATVLLFDRYVAALVLYFLAVGDPAAAVVGQRLGRIRIGTKSLEGTLAFFGASLLVGGVFVIAGAQVSFPLVLVGAASAALAELAPLPFDDNLTVPLLAGGLITAVG